MSALIVTLDYVVIYKPENIHRPATPTFEVSGHRVEEFVPELGSLSNRFVSLFTPATAARMLLAGSGGDDKNPKKETHTLLFASQTQG